MVSRLPENSCGHDLRISAAINFMRIRRLRAKSRGFDRKIFQTPVWITALRSFFIRVPGPLGQGPNDRKVQLHVKHA